MHVWLHKYFIPQQNRYSYRVLKFTLKNTNTHLVFGGIFLPFWKDNIILKIVWFYSKVKVKSYY